MDFQYFPLLVWTICILSGPSVQELLFFGIFCQILWGSFVIYNGPTLQELLNLALFCQIVWGSILLQGWSFKIPHLQYCRRGILNVQPCTFKIHFSRIYIQCFKSKDDNFLSNQQIFQTHFSMLLVDFGSYGGNRGHALPLIRVRKYKINQEHRKVRLKFWLVWRKIVVSRLETL